MKLLTWTLKRPNSGDFDAYYKLKDGEPWYSDKYIAQPEGVDAKGNILGPEAPRSWGHGKETFVRMIEKYPNKFYAIGMHEFGVSAQGKVYNMGYAQVQYPNGYYGGDESKFVLNDDRTEIALPVPTSLRYLMHTYPQIKWSIQFLCVSNKSGNRVDPILDNKKATADAEKGAQDIYIDEMKAIAKLYTEKFPMIKTIEIDFEKTTSRTGLEPGNNGIADRYKFRDLLTRIKAEVCADLGLELRVNLFAMTGDLQPSYYQWHDYRTLAGATYNGKPAIDEYQLMTYDFSWGGSAPGPSTPINWLKQALNHVKKLHDEKVWNKADVLIGNAGYGRRWALGENRLGATLDYKQLMLVQNGTYVHNDGEDAPDGLFHFHNQDFMPISGFNDDESDYQITYLGVYDRFKMTANGGATFKDVNRPAKANYVTNYGRKQFPIFNNVISYDFSGQSNFEEESKGNGEGSVINRFKYVEPDIGDPYWTDGLNVRTRVTGLPDLGSLDDRTGALVQHGYDARPSTGQAPSEDGRITYTLNATGNYKLVALVNYPFFDQSTMTVSINGQEMTVSGRDVEWYPFMQAQEIHFVDLGTFNFSGSNNIVVTDTNGAQIWGFIITEEFSYNMRGGTIEMPVNPQYMKTRDTDNGDLKIKATYPETMRLVGEVLRRPPRPAIIWEDIFSSYKYRDYKGTPWDVTSKGFKYYPQASDGGFSQGSWKAYGSFDEFNDDYSHAYVDSRMPEDGGGGSAQLVLNNKFATDIAIDVELTPDSRDKNALYGLRVLAPENGLTGDGYLCLLDWNKKTVRIVYEKNYQEETTALASAPMTDSLIALFGSRLRLRAYVKNGYISFFVNDKPYFNRIKLPNSAVFTVPTKGAYGVWSKYCRLKLYKFNISSLQRYERMERLKIDVEGIGSYVFDEVERDYTTYPIDDFDLMEYKGYPAEIAASVALPSEQDDGEEATNTADSTVIDTQIDKNYAWSNDYKNKALWTVSTKLPDDSIWTGKRKVTLTMLDGGIWLKSFYLGDNEGMSVAYNSDKVGFIKTANLIDDYGCKGIALWTLGQEDPTIYSYIPDGV